MKKTKIGDNSWFIGNEFTTGKNFKVGANCTIRADQFFAGDYVSIGDNNNFLVEDFFEIYSNGHIGNNNSFTARCITFGDYLYLDSNVKVGLGGCFNYDSTLEVGSGVMLCSWVKLNPNYKIKIGNGVGIGEYVDIWTHGSYPPVLEGFPSQFGPVTIGNDVWLPTKTIVMPNVVIGDNVVVAANSVVTKSLPSGCLAGGSPAKVIRNNCFPCKNKEKNIVKIEEIITEYNFLTAYKKIKVEIGFDKEHMLLVVNGRIFDLNTMKVDGELDEVQEDCRDFLRRQGIKFFTGLPFKSILPKGFKDLLDFK
jgi:acetyltransferase-like isoleucine patch superfamily enzyme